METLNVSVSPFSRRTRSLVVHHTATELTRGLEPDEQVELRDGSTRWIATVCDIDFELADTVYRLELGPASSTDAMVSSGSAPSAEMLSLLRDLAAESPLVSRRNGGARQARRARA